ncbi:hypothetical protein [Dactylosporangium sp. NPDC005555]
MIGDLPERLDAAGYRLLDSFSGAVAGNAGGVDQAAALAVV